MPFPIFIVDAFTTGENDPYTGNPAAVCILEYDDDVSDIEKQKIAMEMNLSETAFVSQGWIRNNNEKYESKLDSKIIKRTLRWFTPVNEVPLCGHATIATSKSIFENNCQINEIEFQSKYEGVLGATIDRETSLITLNFPSNPPQKIQIDAFNWMERIIETTVGPQLTKDDVQELLYSKSTKVLVIRLKDKLTEMDLARISPNFQNLLEIVTEDAVLYISVTVKGVGGGEPDFYSRFFDPWDGLNEDPVTGLAHTVLTPYWNQEIFQKSEGVKTLLARQHSSRGGEVRCLLQGDRVSLSGRARITVKGKLL